MSLNRIVLSVDTIGTQSHPGVTEAVRICTDHFCICLSNNSHVNHLSLLWQPSQTKAAMKTDRKTENGTIQT